MSLKKVIVLIAILIIQTSYIYASQSIVLAMKLNIGILKILNMLI